MLTFALAARLRVVPLPGDPDAGAAGLVFASGLIGGFITRMSQNPWPSLVGQSIGTALFTLVGPLASTIAYLSLREIKEGSLSEDLLAVFE